MSPPGSTENHHTLLLYPEAIKKVDHLIRFDVSGGDHIPAHPLLVLDDEGEADVVGVEVGGEVGGTGGQTALGTAGGSQGLTEETFSWGVEGHFIHSPRQMETGGHSTPKFKGSLVFSLWKTDFESRKNFAEGN